MRKIPPKPSNQSQISITLSQIVVADSRRNSFLARVGVIAVIGFCLLVYLLRLDHTIGLIIDDAWYVLLAQSLATGHGYALINSPSPSILPLYPPGFPALLSIVFRFAPEFPGNLYMLKAVSIAAIFGLGIWSYRYFHRQRELP